MSNDELKQLLDAKFEAFTAAIVGRYELQEQKMETMICHQRETNGRVNKHDVQINGIQNIQSEVISNLKHIRWIRRHPIKATLFLVAGLVILLKIAEWIPLDKILPYIK